MTGQASANDERLGLKASLRGNNLGRVKTRCARLAAIQKNLTTGFKNHSQAALTRISV